LLIEKIDDKLTTQKITYHKVNVYKTKSKPVLVVMDNNTICTKSVLIYKVKCLCE